MDDAVYTALAKCPYFAGLPDAAQARVAAVCTRHIYRAGEQIFSEGEANTHLWMVGTGRAKLYKLNANGDELVLRLMGEGETFNDVSTFARGVTPAHAGALSDATIYSLPAPALHTLIRQDSALAANIVRGLADRVGTLFDRLGDLSLYEVPVRLARFLVEQGERPGHSGPGVTRMAIAAHLATTPQTLSAALRQLEGQRLIRFDRQQVVIVDADGLRTLAGL